MSEWFAIDFETATWDRASACAVGVTAVSNRAVVERRRWLIQPPRNEYDPWNIEIHGITPADTADAPTFPSVWSEVEAYIDGRMTVAHYAGFDMGVLRAECYQHGLQPRHLPYACTVVMGRRQWRGLPSYSLPWVCEHLDIDLNGHHNPSADATACAEIGIRLLTDLGVETFDEAARALEIRLGTFGTVDVRCRSKTARFADANTEADPDHPFYGARMVFTGTLSNWTRAEAAQVVADLGASCLRGVSTKTDYLVVGVQDPTKLRDDGLSGKMRKAAELATRGAEIQILTEVEFLQML